MAYSIIVLFVVAFLQKIWAVSFFSHQSLPVFVPLLLALVALLPNLFDAMLLYAFSVVFSLSSPFEMRFMGILFLMVILTYVIQKNFPFRAELNQLFVLLGAGVLLGTFSLSFWDFLLFVFFGEIFYIIGRNIHNA